MYALMLQEVWEGSAGDEVDVVGGWVGTWRRDKGDGIV